MTDRRRILELSSGTTGRGPVVYWMSRDQRVDDNWALVFAQEQALSLQRHLCVVFALAPSFGGASLRHYSFMFAGLRQVEQGLLARGISFHLLQGEPSKTVAQFALRADAAILVTDFDPLRIKRAWVGAVAGSVKMPVIEVDAHNIVPCRFVSQKAEYGAYTLRPKLDRVLSEFLVEIPKIKNHPYGSGGAVPATDWAAALKWLNPDSSAGEVDFVVPGAVAAIRRMKEFIGSGLSDYDLEANDPCAGGTSRLSPYIHFGQLSAQRLALEVEKSRVDSASKASFLEQLIVRRELADNFCLNNPHYDNLAGLPAWALDTLSRHRKDKREYVYDVARLEQGLTHDKLWNAAQLNMVRHGWMHGYMRMYWAKKILEWTKTPEEALAAANYLNDKYELDGRDPNGYVGTAWAIGGVHDRAWAERPVFGKIRYMNYNGCKSKFDVAGYIQAG